MCVMMNIRLIGGKEDRVFRAIEVDDQISYDDLKKLIQLVTFIPCEFQQIKFRGEELLDIEHPLQSIKFGEEICVSHEQIIIWRKYVEMIEEIRQNTTSGDTEKRRDIADEAERQLSPLLLRSSKFFAVYSSLAIESMHIIMNLNFLIHNIKKYFNRSVLPYFEALYPEQKVELKVRPEECAGTHYGALIFVDDVACYYAKTLGDITEPEDLEIGCPSIDLMLIFTYNLLKLIGLGPIEVHVIPELKKPELAFIATRLIDGFRTASGLSATEILKKSCFKEKATITIDTEMIKQIEILSDLLCLRNSLRNKGNYGVVERQPTEAEEIEGKHGSMCELKIIDFKVDIASIDYKRYIFESTSHIPFLRKYFEKWNVLENIYNAKEEMESIPALKDNKHINTNAFNEFFERLETALKQFLNE